MAEVSVSQFAEVLKVPVDRLLVQLDQAGIKVSGPDARISDDAKLELLTHLRRSHGSGEAGDAAPRKITLKRKTQSELKLASVQGRARTVNVEVRQKKTYIKRDVLEERARHQQDEIDAKRREAEDAVRREAERVENERRERERLESENLRRAEEEQAKLKAAEEARRAAEQHARDEAERRERERQEQLQAQANKAATTSTAPAPSELTPPPPAPPAQPTFVPRIVSTGRVNPRPHPKAAPPAQARGGGQPQQQPRPQQARPQQQPQAAQPQSPPPQDPQRRPAAAAAPNAADSATRYGR